MDNVEQIAQRTYRYFYQDGLVELVTGAFFIAIGLLLLLAQGLLSQSSAAVWAALGLFALTVGAVFVVRQGIGMMKERVVYPRTGYVAYRDQPTRDRQIIIGAALLFGVGVLLLDLLPIDLSGWAQSMALIEGWLLAVILVMLGYRMGIRRFYILAAVGLMVGIGAALAGLDDISGSVVTFGVTGLALTISGGLAFTHYLSAHPHPAERGES